MTGPHSETESSGARPISVAELLARNGTIGAPAVTRRRRRRRGDSDAVTVAELTGEIPRVRVDDHVEAVPFSLPTRPLPGRRSGTRGGSEPPPTPKPKTSRKPLTGPNPSRAGPCHRRSHHARRDRSAASTRGHCTAPKQREPGQSGAEDMSPDPVDHYAGTPVDVMDAEIREAEPATEDSAYVRSYLRDPDSTLFGGQTLADELARRGGAEKTAADAQHGAGRRRGSRSGPADVGADRADETREVGGVRDRLEALWRGTVVVLQSVLAVAFGAGLFVAFDQLWRWNSIVALVLSVLVILGLVMGVRVVRKTEDIASTLIAVAVGALITLGPLALSLQSG